MTKDSLADVARIISDPSDTTSKPLYFYERYEMYFSSLRTDAIKMLELGVHKGESLKVFSSYFARGHVFGVDIRNHGIDLSSFKNATFGEIDQRDGAALNAFTDAHAPEGWDIIIDDASHYGSWSLLTFNALFPRLKAGGLYVVEDWATGYWDDWADGARYQELPVPVQQDHIPPRVPSHDAGMVGFIKKLVDEICNKPATTRSSFISHPAKFDWMHINDTFAVLRKRTG